jgi:hypothetical protein
MPNPRNRLKLTGDTHLPDVGDDAGEDGDVLRFEPVRDEDAQPQGAAQDRVQSFAQEAEGALQPLRGHVRAHPLAAVAAAFVLGYMLG